MRRMVATGTRGGSSNTDTGWGQWRRHRSIVAQGERERRGKAPRVEPMGRV
jgi:hypothetical protein